MLETPQIVQTQSQPIAYIHLTIPREDMGKHMGPSIGELMSTLAAQGIAPVGPVFAHHLKCDARTFDFELGVGVSKPATESGRVQGGIWPAMKVARTVLHGPYDGLPEAWGQFDAWVADQGLLPADDLWECYVTNPQEHPDPATWQTQLNRPLLD